MRHTNHNIQILICSLIITAAPLFGEVKMQVRDGRPIVDGIYVNGHGPYRFLVDTGANVNLIEMGLAGKMGMNATFQVDLASAAGKTATQGSDGNEVVLDAVKAEGQKFLFSGLEAIHHLSPDIQGVLGQWFLFQFDYTLDLRGKRLEFGKQDRNGMRSRFRMVNARPVVSTSLGDLALDSGSARLVLFGVQADVGSSFKGQLRTIAGSQQIGMASRKRLIIEGRRIWDGDAVAIPNRPEAGVDGLLPLACSRRSTFAIRRATSFSSE
jgi:hypothetical protein